jgi:cysteine-rich repeat protein
VCTNVCKPATCGDGFKQPGEQCDAGVNNSDTGTCTLACTLPVCGDGFAQPSNGEQCDDANQDNNDACTTLCLNAACGDGFIQPGEQCDDGNLVSTDLCTGLCNNAACGDGFTQPALGESCDDGNMVPNDGCEPGCGITCKQVNGLLWCYNPAACGQPCNAVCSVYGKVPVANQTTWLQAQDTSPECQAIADAFAIPGVVQINSFTYACAEDQGSNHMNQTFVGPLLCSNFNGCPQQHLTLMDQNGIDCNSPQASRRSICPCE